jgi:hypothetical protein
MPERLVLHPDSSCAALSSVSADIEITRGVVSAQYIFNGDVDDIVWPIPAESKRTDGLWETTCCEFYLTSSVDSGSSYYEFNLSPSSNWAAYGFTGYRRGRYELDIRAPSIRTSRRTRDFILSARWDLGEMMRYPVAVGLSVIVKRRGGDISYWALTHPAGKEDFHHPDCFARHISGSP